MSINIALIFLLLAPYAFLLGKSMDINRTLGIYQSLDVVLVVMLGLAILFSFLNKEKLKYKNEIFMVAFSPYIFLYVITIFTYGYSKYFTNYFFILNAVTTYTAYAVAVNKNSFLDVSKYFKIFIGALILIYFIELFIFDWGMNSTGGIGNRNWMANLLIASIAFFIGGIFSESKKEKFLSLSFLILILAINYFYLKNKFLYIAIPIISIIYGVLYLYASDKIKKSKLIFWLFILIIVSVLIALLDKNFISLFNYDKLADRLLIWELGVHKISENLFFGSGMGSFWQGYHEAKYLKPEIGLLFDVGKTDYEFIHNEFLEFLYEGGVIYLAMHIVIFAYIFILVVHYLRNSESVENKSKIITLFVASFIIFVHSLIDVVLKSPVNKFIFYLFLFLIVFEAKKNIAIFSKSLNQIFKILIFFLFGMVLLLISNIFVNNKNCFSLNAKYILEKKVIDKECSNPRFLMETSFTLAALGHFDLSQKLNNVIQEQYPHFMDSDFLEVYNKLSISNGTLSENDVSTLKKYLTYHRGSLHLLSQNYIKNNNYLDFLATQKLLIKKIAFDLKISQIKGEINYYFIAEDNLLISYRNGILEIGLSEKYIRDLMTLGSGKYGCEIVNGFKAVLKKNHTIINTEKENLEKLNLFADLIINNLTSYCFKYQIVLPEK